MMDPFRELALRDGRFAPEAYQFLLDSLDHAIRLAGRSTEKGPDRHVTGRELLEGLKVYALDLFGPLGAHVWRSWGIQSTLDWGKIVFLLVDSELLSRQESDSIDDFRDAFDIDAVFGAYRPKLPPELGPQAASDEV
jgi:uncharacterized repeat protein (TIGR04138 family)